MKVIQIDFSQVPAARMEEVVRSVREYARLSPAWRDVVDEPDVLDGRAFLRNGWRARLRAWWASL